MTPLYSRRVPQTWFFASGLFRPHWSLLRQGLLYAVLTSFFVAVLWKLGQFAMVPQHWVDWTGIWTGLSSDKVAAETLAALAQIKTVIIIALSIVIVVVSLFRRVGPALSRWCIDEAYARATRDIFLQVETEGVTREPKDLLHLMPQGDSTLSSYLAFQRMIQNTSLVSQDSPAGIMESVRDAIGSEARLVGSTQRLLLHLGILGTFIGLMFAAPSLGFISGGSSDKEITDGLQNLFTALATCFTTSIAGLLGSIVVGGAGGILRRMHERYLRSLEDALLTVQAVVSDTLMQNVGKSDFGAIWHALHLQNDRLHAQTESIRKGMESLGDVKTIFEALEKALTAFQGQMMEVKNVFSSQELAGALATSIRESVRSSLNDQTVGQQKVSDALTLTTTTLSSLNASLTAQRQAARKETELLQATYTKLAAEMLDRVRSDNTQILGATAERLDKAVATLRVEIEAHEKALRYSPGHRLIQWACAITGHAQNAWRRFQQQFLK
jgi:hypothetical protein